MATETQILANRRNPQKTNGPRTNRLSSPACQRIMTSIMQNKANFRKAKMKLNFYSTKDYENEPRLRTPGKQTQSNPIKPNFKGKKIPWNSLLNQLTSDLETYLLGKPAVGWVGKLSRPSPHVM